MPITWERMFPTGGWKPNKPHNVKSVATSNIAVLENEEVNNTEKKSRFGEAATLELSNNYFREKSPNSAAMLMESKAAARTLKVGSRGEDVKRLQENLNTLGYNTGKPDGIFGNGTKNAVIAFQRAKGLTADGIVGSGTQNAITRALNEKTAAANSNILKVGSKGAKVTQLQRNLNSLGYNAGTPDGAFGTGTKNAVVSFQKTYGLSADGVAGKATQDAIATTISRKSKGILSKGQVSNDVKNLQNDLKTLGYLASNADGAFGTGTEAAVKAFQKNHKLTQDGLVGASTRSQISAAVKAKIERENSVLKLGSKGDKVKNLQSNLNELGYKAGTPDGQFGSGTQDAVIRFQKTYGLTPDGQAGTNTLNAISKSLNYKRNNVLAKGQVSEDVRNLQNNLKSLGYLSGTADGAFGAGTEAALKAFQKRHGLTEDGLAGKNTRVKIADAVKNKTATPVNTSKVLKLGSSGAEVEKLQKDLKDIGYTITDKIGEFGKSTEDAIRKLQLAFGLNDDGKVGDITKNALDKSTAIKKRGNIGIGRCAASVVTIQETMQKMGYFFSKVTGIFDKNTNDAVSHYKRDLKNGYLKNSDIENNIMLKNLFNKIEIDENVNPYKGNNSNVQKRLDKLYFDNTLKVSNETKKGMMACATKLLNAGYDANFVAGMLGNMAGESSPGGFESSFYREENLRNKRDYLWYIDNNFGYAEEFSGKNIMDVGIKKTEELQLKCKESGYQGKFGLGMVQWTDERTNGLLEYYKKYSKGDKPTLDECIEAETEYMKYELGNTKKYIYDEWSNPERRDKTVDSATEIIFTKYEKAGGDNLEYRKKVANAIMNIIR